MTLDAGLGINRVLPLGFTMANGPLILGGVNFFGCLITVGLIIERINRRVNMLGGYLFMTPLLVMLAIFLYAGNHPNWELFLSSMFILSFELSVGPLVYLVTTELLPLRFLSYCNCFNWFANTLIICAMETGT